MSAAAVLFSSEEQILLVERTWTPELVLPGGVIEVGESARVAAEREVLEELGLRVRVGRLLIHDGRLGMDHYVFEGGAIPDLGELDPDFGNELAAVHVLPIDIGIARHVERGRPRLRAAVDALECRRTRIDLV